MSAVAPSNKFIALPETQVVAQELAYRMIQVNADFQKIMNLFAEKATFFWGSDTKMDKIQFSETLMEGSIENITAIGQWKDTFQASKEGLNEIIWKIDGLQHRLGKIMKEDGPGWYQLQQTILLKFVEEDKKMKISEFHSTHYTKTKLPESKEIKALSLSQSIIRKLALKSFEIPQQTESLIKLYDMYGFIIFEHINKSMYLDEFSELMRQSNTLNVTHIGEWSNTYSPVEGNEKMVQWIAEGSQRRLGLGANEDGEGWYKIRQLSQFYFSDYSGKIGIGEQHVKEYSKSKVVEPETISEK